MNTVYNCKVCGSTLSGKQRSFCSLSCKNKHFQSYHVLKQRALERKTKLIDTNGGCCQLCGYRGSLDALSFYDKYGKSLRIDTNMLANCNLEKLHDRVKGSQILCKNCSQENEDSVELEPSSPPANEGIIKKFTENLLHCGVKPNHTIILGVSGGVDSITMLDLFAKSETKTNVVVAHLNHGIRAEAKNDEMLVSKLAKQYGFKYISKTITKPKGGNLEENLRNARRKFLLDWKDSCGAQYIALAHNANDQAETFIMNALRGSGPAGLGSMSMSTDQIIRPLLNLSRHEIESYAHSNKLTWNEDVTNKDIGFDRNYVRHRILPLFSRLNPEYLSAIARTTHLQRQIDNHFKEEAYRIMKDARVENLKYLDKPLLYEVLGLLYEEIKGDRQNLTLHHLSEIEYLISSTSGTKSLDLPGNISVTRRYDRLDFSQKKEHNIPSTPSLKNLKIGKQRFGDWEIIVSVSTSLASRSKKSHDRLIVDEKLLPSIVIRTRKDGDRISTKGMPGRKRLQDLFVDAKIDRVKRKSWPIFTLNHQIIWVPGLAKANIENKSKKLLNIDIKEVAHETNQEK